MTIIDNNTIKHFVNEEFDNAIQGPIKFLFSELVLEIFSHLNLACLGKVCQVNNKWKRLASEPNLWKITIYRDLAFGNDKWAKHFGVESVKDEECGKDLSSFPWKEYIADCKKFKRLFPKIKALEDIVPVWLPLTLNGQLDSKMLGDLIQEKLMNKMWIGYPDPKEPEVETINQSHWAFITTASMRKPRDEDISNDKLELVRLNREGITDYEVSGTLESVVCNVIQCFRSTFFSVSSFLEYEYNRWSFTSRRGFHIKENGIYCSKNYTCYYNLYRAGKDHVDLALVRRF